MADYRKRIDPPAQYKNMLGNRSKKPLSVQMAEAGLEVATPLGTVNDIQAELQKENPNYALIAGMAGLELLGPTASAVQMAAKAGNKGLLQKILDAFKKDPEAGYDPVITGSGAGPRITEFSEYDYTNDPRLRGSPEDLGFTEDAYHYTRSEKIDKDKFDPDLAISNWNRLGIHVGTKKAAKDRFTGTNDPEFPEEAKGTTLPLKVRTNKPLMFSDEVESELSLRNKLVELAESRGLDPLDWAEDLRKQLAEEGYTHIPYINEVEDEGSISYIMLTDRPKNSDAVLRSRFAKFDPSKKDKPELGMDEGGLAESKGLSWGELIVDNILGLDNEYESFGEKLGKAINEDEIKFLKDAAVGVYEGTKEFVQAPVETTKQVVNEIKDSVTRLGSEDLNTRLQRMYNVTYEQATDEQVNQAREAVLGDALTALELVPAAKGATTVAKAGIAAVPGGFKADVVGQTKAMLSGDKEFLSGTPSNRASTQSLSAGFTGQNPPTYQKRDKPLSQQGDVELDEFRQPQPTEKTELSRKDFVVFRDPIKELAQTVTIPKKGLLGSEFLKMIKKNESIADSSLQPQIIDPKRRYTREELLEAIGDDEGYPGPNVFRSETYIGERQGSFRNYQRQGKDAGFLGIGKELDYFELPVLSSPPSGSEGTGKPFKANLQHFDEDTIAHARGSIVQPADGVPVSFEYEDLIGQKPFLLVEEIQSDLLQKGYVKPGKLSDMAFKKVTEEWSRNNYVSFQEAFGEISKDVKNIFEELDEANMVRPDLVDGFGARNKFQRNSANRGYVLLDELEETLDKLNVRPNEIGEFTGNLLDHGRGFYQIIDASTGQEIPVGDFLERFQKETYVSPKEKTQRFFDKSRELLAKKQIDKEINFDEFQYLYERYKTNQHRLEQGGYYQDIGLPPITKNKQAVEESLKALIAKAAREGVDKIVIPPAERIAKARGRTLDSSDKGDRFYRTYVTDLNKVLNDLEKNYPVEVRKNVQMPYDSRVESEAIERGLQTLGYRGEFEAFTVPSSSAEVSIPDDIDYATLRQAIDREVNAENLTDEQEQVFRAFAFHNQISFDEVPQVFSEWHVKQTDELFKKSWFKEMLPESDTAYGTILDISELVDEYRVEAPRQFAEGGTVDMNQQMSFAFADGGLRDDGMRQDPVSGNEVPAGSMAEEVRDDIPAQLSEGEYVVPADVVRYYGVKFFEDLRDNAKMGLQDMEARGRIGGEPVPEGGPTNDDDLTPEELAAIQEMMGMAKGGVVGYQTGGLQTDQDVLAAGQQAQQRQFTGFPLGATIFPRAESGEIEAVPTTTTPEPVQTVGGFAPTISVQETAESCARKGMSYDPATQTCIPTSANDSPPPPPPESKPWYEGVDWTTTDIADPTAIESIVSLIPGVGQVVSMRNIAGQYAKANILEAAGDIKGANQIRDNIEEYIGKQSLATKIVQDGFGRYADGDWMTIEYLNSIGIETPDGLKTEDGGGMPEFIKGLANDPVKSALIAGSISPERKKLIDQSVAAEEAKRVAAAKAAAEAQKQTAAQNAGRAARSLANRGSNSSNAAQLAAIQKAQKIAQKAADAGTSIAEQTQTGSGGYGTASSATKATGGKGSVAKGSGWGGMNQGGLMANKPKTKTKRQYKKGGLAGKK
jgi:hypothetical protein